MEIYFQENIDYFKYFKFTLSLNENTFTFKLICFWLHVAENYPGSYNKEGKLAYLTEKDHMSRRRPTNVHSIKASAFLQSPQPCPQPSFIGSVLLWK